MSSELKRVAEQALKELSEARKIIRASSSRQLAKDWDRRATAVLADLRTAIQQTAQPAEVTDVMIDAIAAQHTWSVDYPTRFVTDARAVVRAVLALHPVPMADEHLSVLKEMADRCPELNLSNYGSDDVDELNSWAVEIAVYIDGITAQGKKETP